MARTTPHLLVVDDDLLTCTRHKHYFEAQGYRVSVAHDGTQMWQILNDEPAALILLDVGLPGKDGIELARELRAHDDYLGIILVSARSDDVDRIVGLESGANDYVTKPFNSRELLARVKIVLRETHLRRPAQRQWARQFGSWELDLVRRVLIDQDGRHVVLPHGEMSLLVALAQNPGVILNRDQLLQHFSDRPWDATGRSIDVLISRLRRKLESNPQRPELILTVRGEGYMLVKD